MKALRRFKAGFRAVAITASVGLALEPGVAGLRSPIRPAAPTPIQSSLRSLTTRPASLHKALPRARE